MAEHKFLIVLKDRTEIPPEAVVMNSIGTDKEFADPWQNGWQEKSGLPKPPMEVHNAYCDGTQLEVHYGGQTLKISVEGEVCVDPDYKVDTKKIKKVVELLPDIWKWGVNVRRSQDAIFEKIIALLPEWEIVFSERERTFFSEETLKEIVAVLEKFRQFGENVPIVQKCMVKEVVST